MKNKIQPIGLIFCIIYFVLLFLIGKFFFLEHYFIAEKNLVGLFGVFMSIFLCFVPTKSKKLFFLGMIVVFAYCSGIMVRMISYMRVGAKFDRYVFIFNDIGFLIMIVIVTVMTVLSLGVAGLFLHWFQTKLKKK